MHLILLLYWLERIDSFHRIHSVSSPVYAVDLPNSCFMTPLGVHITSESLCCYNGKIFNWFSFPNCLKCFSLSVYNGAFLESVLQKLFPLWANQDFQSSSETVCCTLQRRCNGIVSQHHFGCTFMRPWSETELKPVRGPGLELRCLLKENQ